VTPFEFCRDFRRQKIRVQGLPSGVVCVILRLAVSIEHRLVTDGRIHDVLKPWFHVQLLHAIILGSGRGYRCQSVCECDVTSKMPDHEKNTVTVLATAASAATISLVAF